MTLSATIVLANPLPDLGCEVQRPGDGVVRRGGLVEVSAVLGRDVPSLVPAWVSVCVCGCVVVCVVVGVVVGNMKSLGKVAIPFQSSTFILALQ